LLATYVVLCEAIAALIIAIVDYIAEENSIPTKAAGQLIFSARIFSLSVSIFKARHIALL